MITGDDSVGFKICCNNIPTDFLLDKQIAKDYFREFGKFRRLIFKPKSKSCVVEYISSKSVASILQNGGLYNGQTFEVIEDVPSPSEEEIKEASAEKRKDPDWTDDPEVQEELRAMSGTFGVKEYALRPKVLAKKPSLTVTKKETKPILSVKRTLSAPDLIKPKKTKLALQSLPVEYLDLVQLLREPAKTAEQKFQVLDARDKLIRFFLKFKSKKEGATKGTCSDMCPEKERLMRIHQHQVALFETEHGTRQMNPSLAVKQYSRSSADQEMPLAHELRPVAVLQVTMRYLLHKIANLGEDADVNLAEWYHFLWDRTRAVRKDITQQELCCQVSVSLVEQCARFHVHCSARLVKEEPSTFDQKINTENLTKCLQTLKYMYHDLALKGEFCPNEPEFRAYIILLNLNDGNFMWEVQQLRREIQKSPEVRFALSIYSSVDRNNFIKFFKFVRQTTYLNACLLMRYFVQVRTKALEILVKVYAHRATVYPLDDLINNLGFEDTKTTVEFLAYHGLSCNEEHTHVVLHGKSFFIPDFPFSLGRSLSVVETKRTLTVGEIITGKPSSLHDSEMLIPHSSFNSRSCLRLTDFFTKTEILFLKSYESNVKEKRSKSKPKESDSPKRTASKTVLVKEAPTLDEDEPMSLENQEGIRKEPDVLLKNVFAPPSFENQNSSSSNTVKFGGSPFEEQDSLSQSIFASRNVAKNTITFEQNNDKTDDIFASKKPIVSQSLFHQSTQSLFEKPKISDPANLFSSSNTNIFSSISTENDLKPVIPVVTLENKTIFGGNADTSSLRVKEKDEADGNSILFPKIPTITQFKFPSTDVPSISGEIHDFIPKINEKMDNNNKINLSWEDHSKTTGMDEKIEEEKRKNKEREERKKAMEILEKQKIELKKACEEKLRKNAELLLKKQIDSFIELLIKETINDFKKKRQTQKLNDLARKLKRNKTLLFLKKWLNIARNNKRKRQIVNCNPVILSTKTLSEEAEELKNSSQDLTLNDFKRYKLGSPGKLEMSDTKIIGEFKFDKISQCFRKRCTELEINTLKTFYWKIDVCVPDSTEMPYGLNVLNETLQSYFNWSIDDNVLRTVKKFHFNHFQSVAYCFEKKQVNYVDNNLDSNGLIIFALNLNKFLSNLEKLNYKTPIVFILKEIPKKTELDVLSAHELIFDYFVLTQNNLVETIDKGLAFLASRMEKPNDLKLDTMKAFIVKNCCEEIWQNVKSFGKWNSDYQSRLKNPQTVINIHNSAMEKIRNVLLDPSDFNRCLFPDAFKKILLNQIPESFPCDYKYFPKFYKDEDYLERIAEILTKLKLPSLRKWPPQNERECQITLSEYCENVFEDSKKVFYKMVAVLQRNFDEEQNFENIVWTDIIEVLAMEKINEINFSLEKTRFKNQSIFNQLIVVYNPINLNKFLNDPWYYVSKEIYKPELENYRMDSPESVTDKMEECLEMSEEVDKLFEENILEARRETCDSSKIKRDFSNFNSMLSDLEESLKVHKVISSKVNHILEDIINDV